MRCLESIHRSLEDRGHGNVEATAGHLTAQPLSNKGNYLPSLAAAVDRSLLEIDRAIEDVSAGSGRVVVVGGAAGVGKSALLSDAARAAASQELVVAGARASR